MGKKKLSTFDIVLTAMFSAILIVSKEILAWLPNIEIVTMLIILYTRHFPRHTFYIIYIFAGAQCCLYGLFCRVLLCLDHSIFYRAGTKAGR